MKGEELTMEWALRRSKELFQGRDPKAEELLRHKCNWEGMTRTDVLIVYGDPTTWKSYPDQ